MATQSGGRRGEGQRPKLSGGARLSSSGNRPPLHVSLRDGSRRPAAQPAVTTTGGAAAPPARAARAWAGNHHWLRWRRRRVTRGLERAVVLLLPPPCSAAAPLPLRDNPPPARMPPFSCRLRRPVWLLLPPAGGGPVYNAAPRSSSCHPASLQAIRGTPPHRAPGAQPAALSR